MFTDFVLNGQAHGEVGSVIGGEGVRFDPGMLRPFINNRGVQCVTINTGRQVQDNKTGLYVPVYKTVPTQRLRQQGIDNQVWNTSGIRKDAWILLDQAVIRAARLRLRAWADLAASSTFGGFNGMSKLTLEYESATDPGEAIVDMDGLADGRTDAPLYNLRSIPLPITHSDFWFSARRLAVSRQTNTPLDTTMAEAAGRRIAEMIEKTTIGIEPGVNYGTRTTGPFPHDGSSKVYGYTNFPYRITKTNLATPTGANPEAVMGDVLNMVETLTTAGFYGPYMLYTSTGYSRYLNDDYFRAGGTAAVRTLRERIMSIEGIQDIRRLDYLTSGYQMILVQMTPDVARAINGMDITTVRWESQGGMRENFKVMCIQVPQLRANFSGVTGVLHATTS